jgi:hypothetical protein
MPPRIVLLGNRYLPKMHPNGFVMAVIMLVRCVNVKSEGREKCEKSQCENDKIGGITIFMDPFSLPSIRFILHQFRIHPTPAPHPQPPLLSPLHRGHLAPHVRPGTAAAVAGHRSHILIFLNRKAPITVVMKAKLPKTATHTRGFTWETPVKP